MTEKIPRLFSRSVYLVLSTFLICVTAKSQTVDSLLRVYNSETIHTFGKLYIKGNTQLKFRDLKPEFTSVLQRIYIVNRGQILPLEMFVRL